MHKKNYINKILHNLMKCKKETFFKPFSKKILIMKLYNFSRWNKNQMTHFFEGGGVQE